MPQASDEQRALMAKWFHSELGINDGPPYKFLSAHGWTEWNGVWKKPTPCYNPSFYEIECLKFIRDEWDYDWEKPLFQET